MLILLPNINKITAQEPDFSYYSSAIIKKLFSAVYTPFFIASIGFKGKFSFLIIFKNGIIYIFFYK